jgi:serine/threonine protein kinase
MEYQQGIIPDRPFDLDQNTDLSEVINYSEILAGHGLKFRRADRYLEIGNADWVQGWLIELSAILSQIPGLLNTILPLLDAEKVPFKVIRNAEKAYSILTGEYGDAHLAKIITIYPKDDKHANSLALKLLPITSPFRGPEIPTSRRLGEILYARYGAGQPIIRINQSNQRENYIYDVKGNVIKEPMPIPFSLPIGISWPFENIIPAKTPKKETVLQDRYKPIHVLKNDVKGSVRKGLWLKKFYQIKWCVIKEGRRQMFSDKSGRTIEDRLAWQFELQKDLHGKIPIPEIYDLFTENGDNYLVMEYIKGDALNTVTAEYFRNSYWQALPVELRVLLLNYGIQLVDITDKMHQLGYLHRDIAPGNFLVDKDHQIWLIDLELAYSFQHQKPLPAFGLGTPGFMSKEQEESAPPSMEQDVYSLGAVLILLFTNLYPDGFTTNEPVELAKQLMFFLNDQEMVDILVSCLSIHPYSRPSLTTLKKILEQFQRKQLELTSPANENRTVPQPVDKKTISNLISGALATFPKDILTNRDKIWLSRTENKNEIGYSYSKSYAVYTTFYQGLSGIIYILSQAHQAGFPISKCLPNYEASLAYIRNDNYSRSSDAPGGLYSGTAGIALGLIEAIKSGLLAMDDSVLEDIQFYLNNNNLYGVGIAKGLAGKGIVLLHALQIINDISVADLLGKIVNELIYLQQKDGSWITETDNNKKRVKVTGIGHGVAGITCFLIAYYRSSDDSKVIPNIQKALGWLISQSQKKGNQRNWYIDSVSKQMDAGLHSGTAGIVLCFLKAFELLGDQQYRQVAEETLVSLPLYLVKSDLTLSNGITGVGELCIEASRILKEEKWLRHADWIAQFLLHYHKRNEDDSIYWLTESIPHPTAGLMEGNGGIIHFLIKYYQSNERASLY